MRASRDAAEQCFIALAKRDSAQWVLDADISGCFDNISHDWLITNIPMDKVILQKWLKSGFVWQNQWFPTEGHAARRYHSAYAKEHDLGWDGKQATGTLR